ncbi:hypothetical protein SCA6_002435 [Theobroma cacao]
MHGRITGDNILQTRLLSTPLGLFPPFKSKSGYPLSQYQGFWCSPDFLEDIILSQEGFKAEPNDIFVCSVPKSDTESIAVGMLTIIGESCANSFETIVISVCGPDSGEASVDSAMAVIRVNRYDTSTSPLLSKISHDCIPTLAKLTKEPDSREPGIPLVGTHTPYTALPKSILDSDCKIVYICREPKDAFVALYHFLAKRAPKKNEFVSLEEAFDLFCQGKSFYGPYLDHVLGFWKASQARPGKVLFPKYEDMMKDTAPYVKRLAEFMGYPFSLEEEEAGAVQRIVDLCGFENMSSLEVNKSGLRKPHEVKVENSFYFRKGRIGDWKEYLTPEMAERLDKMMEQKFAGTGLTFLVSC